VVEVDFVISQVMVQAPPPSPQVRGGWERRRGRCLSCARENQLDACVLGGTNERRLRS
jgi:hypothetical protein